MCTNCTKGHNYLGAPSRLNKNVRIIRKITAILGNFSELTFLKMVKICMFALNESDRFRGNIVVSWLIIAFFGTAFLSRAEPYY